MPSSPASLTIDRLCGGIIFFRTASFYSPNLPSSVATEKFPEIERTQRDTCSHVLGPPVPKTQAMARHIGHRCLLMQGQVALSQLPLQENHSIRGRRPHNILYPVPHRQFVFSIPIMLGVHFKYDRKLLTQLCHCAKESLDVVFSYRAGRR